ncbi:MAG: ABC transporter ATP-binding protein [Actinobacteria bacterium]|nr:ABC transporter ATP-binding protein [Actinomycetota bacterium]
MAPTKAAPAPPSPEPSAGGSVLDVRDLRVEAADGSCTIVEQVSFSVAAGERLGVVGESGSGKTTVATGLLGYARPGTRIAGGTVNLGGIDMLALEERERRHRRGHDIAYVPQDPATGLSPGVRIGKALREMLEVHDPAEADVDGRVALALREAQLPDDADFQARYPHQLSGGQQQRVAIALALICRPSTIVMDEPTTGLDVTTQARLLEVVREILAEHRIAMVYVTHDLGVVRNLVDEVAVMYGGRIVESGPVEEIFARPHHPYTRRLLEAVPRISPTAFQPREIPGSAVEPWDWPAGCPFAPRCDYRTDACEVAMPPLEAPATGRALRCVNWRTLPERSAGLTRVLDLDHAAAAAQRAPTLLAVQELDAGYGGNQLAVESVSFAVPRGACTAVVGESGSGKTTTLRCIAGLHVPTSGSIRLDGAEIAGRARRREPALRRRIQLVPQNPDSSLNPRRTIEEIIVRPLRQFFSLGRAERRRRTLELLEQVRLPAGMAYRYPRELSGGQRQRVAIARALAAEPELLLCDEVVAALDVAVQAGILELLEDLRADLGMTVVFVSHDLAVVRSISAETVVMAGGRVREVGPTEPLFRSPVDECTQALLADVPDLRASDYPGEPDI